MAPVGTCIGFWDDVMQAAMLGKLDRADEATIHLGQVAEQKPDFSDRACELLRRGIKIDPLIDNLIDGLRRAGMRGSGSEPARGRAPAPWGWD